MELINDESEPLAAPASKIQVGINDLDGPIRGMIFNYLEQTEIPNVSLVCKKWKREIDDLYEFEWTIGYNPYYSKNMVEHKRINYIDKKYAENIVWDPELSVNSMINENPVLETFMKKCTKCTILSMVKFPHFDDNFQFMKHPTCLKELRILAPLEPQYVQHIVSSSINLERLEFGEFSNFPFNLSLAQTPGLAQLKSLKKLFCSREDDYKDDDSFVTKPIVQVSSFMDCHFPKLERLLFELPPFGTIHPALLWKFLNVHASTLQRIWLRDVNWEISTNSELEDFRSANVPNFVEMTIITNCWCPFWEQILSKQSKLQKLDFNTDLSDSDDDEHNLAGLPWIYFEAPIMNSSNTLKSVYLSVLDMIIGNRCRPLNLSIFKSCLQLTVLDLRGLSRPGNPEEKIMINGNDLPSSLLELTLSEITMLSSDLILTIEKLKNLETLKLYGLGKTGNFGATSSVLTAISGLDNLNGLIISKLNTSDSEENEKLRIQIESLGKQFKGSDTCVLFETNAHVELTLLQEKEDG